MNDQNRSGSLVQHLGIQIVLLAGLATALSTTAGVYLLDTRTDDLHVMGWYVWFIIPAGAIAVGLAAGSGYAAGSWVTGTRVSGLLLAAVLTLQSAAFVAMHYSEFKAGGYVDRRSGEPIPFLTYVDAVARSFRFKDSSSREGFGAFGYAYLGLQGLGFVGGGMAASLVLLSKPYCQGCGLYKRTKRLLALPGSPDKESGTGELPPEEAWKNGLALMESVMAMAASEERQAAQGFEEIAAAHRKARSRYFRSAACITLDLVSCPRCRGAEVAGIARVGGGQHLKETEVARVRVPEDFARRHA